MAKNSKRAQAVEIMNANKDKSMSDVVTMIAKAIDVSEPNARSYYRWIVANGLAEGKVETKAKTKAEKPAKVAKEPKAKVEKPAKDKTKKFTGKIKVKAETKVESKNLSDDEVAKIKAANLKKMKEVTAKNKYLPGQMARPYESDGDGPVRTTAQAKVWIKAEEKRIDEEMRERDYPKFLSKDQAKLLVG